MARVDAALFEHNVLGAFDLAEEPSNVVSFDLSKTFGKKSGIPVVSIGLGQPAPAA